MYTVTTFSNRLYDLDKHTQEVCMATIKDFNSIKYHVYNLLFLEQNDKAKYDAVVPVGVSIHMYTKNKFKLNTYYTNSIVNEAKAMLNLQMALINDYVKQKEANIKSITNKSDKCKKQLKNYIQFRDDFLLYEKKIKDMKLNNQDISKEKLRIKGITNLTIKGDKVEVRIPCKRQIKKTTYSLYQFEYEYLNPKIKHLRNLIGKYKHRIENLNRKIEKIKTPKRIVWGGKKLLSKYNKADAKDKPVYLQLIRDKHYRDFAISGRKDTTYSNCVFKATPITTGTKTTFNIEVKFMRSDIVTFQNITFPYRGEDLKRILLDKSIKEPICFGIVRKLDKSNNKYYYQFSVSFNLEATHRINYDKSTGVIGMDFNHGHLDLSDIDAKGNLLGTKTIYYSINGTSEENALSLRNALDEVGKYVDSKHKILVIEDLNTKDSKTKANRDETNQKELNYILHSFSYARYNEMVDYLKIKYNFEVKRVSPKYTSIIGKLKYSDRMKLNSHVSASYVIARRGLGFQERILKHQRELIPSEMKYKHNWAKWNYLNKLNKQNTKAQATA